MRLLDRSAQTNRWRSVPTAEKLSVTLSALGVSLLSPSPAVQAALLAVTFGLAVFGAGIAAKDWLKLAALPLAFILTGTLAQALTLDLSGAWPRLGLAGRHDLARASFFVLRGLASVSALLFLALTTPLTTLIAWVERRGLNPHLADMALLMFRMIWLALDSLERGEQALKNRLGHRGLGAMLRSHGLLLAALLPRVLAHARRLESGLAARGYEGRLVFLGQETAARPARIALTGLGSAVLLGLGFLA